MVVHIIEVGYTSDASHRDSLQRKRVQHNCLISHLLDAGWRIHTVTTTAPTSISATPTTIASHDQRAPAVLPPSLAVPQTPAAATLHGHTADSPPGLPAQDHPAPCLWCGTVHPDYSHHVHIVLLSTSGIIYKPILPLLEFFEVSRPAIHTLLSKLALRAVTFADSISRLRRRLERDPATFTAVRPASTHDPP